MLGSIVSSVAPATSAALLIVRSSGPVGAVRAIPASFKALENRFIVIAGSSLRRSVSTESSTAPRFAAVSCCCWVSS